MDGGGAHSYPAGLNAGVCSSPASPPLSGLANRIRHFFDRSTSLEDHAGRRAGDTAAAPRWSSRRGLANSVRDEFAGRCQCSPPLRARTNPGSGTHAITRRRRSVWPSFMPLPSLHQHPSASGGRRHASGLWGTAGAASTGELCLRELAPARDPRKLRRLAWKNASLRWAFHESRFNCLLLEQLRLCR